MKGKRVLVAPLDWGLGHATRCIPLIQDLLADGAEVVLGCSEVTRPILQEAFPQLEQCILVDHKIRYSFGNDQLLSLAIQIPQLWLLMRKERRLVSKICKEQEIDVIISDNRIGCRAKGVHNIFITHQAHIKAPIFEAFFRRHLHRIIEQFDELWMPDLENAPGLAGELSHGPALNIKTKYIGPLSRFVPQNAPIRKNTLIAVLSGPEPQRSIFERQLLQQMEPLDLECTLIRGLPNSKNTLTNDRVKVIDHLPPGQLARQMAQSEFIVCRSGYSTIMDLNALGRSAILVPTPGQTEQEYLARIQEKHIRKICVPQPEFNLNRILRMISSKEGDDNKSITTQTHVEDPMQAEGLQTAHPA